MLMGEHGGWPLTMFLTPAGEPFWGGTYFPKVSRFGKPAFVDVLREVARVFREEPKSIEQNRSALMSRLAETKAPPGKVIMGPSQLDQSARTARRADRSGARRHPRRAEIPELHDV